MNTHHVNLKVDKVITPIVLSTLNAKYIHSAFGLRYLKANLGRLSEQCQIEEFTLETRPIDIVEILLRHSPRIVGFGVYIWNIRQTEEVVALLKTLAPDIKIILGGPEVSYEQEQQRIVANADYVISGWGEQSFRDLCEELLTESKFATGTQAEKFIAGIQPKLSDIRMPYHLYSEADIRNRVLYVEASRGCPFKCEFCLSALDKTAWPFDLDLFLAEMDALYKRGARHFKFVDRTFNLKVKNSLKILDFFLDRMDENLFLHFEVVPDHLPNALKEKIALFPAGVLQFEVGIQTFNPDIQARISRRQNNEAAEQNLTWIRNSSGAHIHADLIFGLPGESLASFAESFDRLYRLRPHEIQLGILKRLKGSPIVRHTNEFDLIFNPEPPFNILANTEADFLLVQRINRFARFWDMVGNSGRFKNALPLLLDRQPFNRFLKLSDMLFEASGQTHKISLLRLYDLVFQCAETSLVASERLRASLAEDFAGSGLKSIPKCLRGNGPKTVKRPPKVNKAGNSSKVSRQIRHHA